MTGRHRRSKYPRPEGTGSGVTSEGPRTVIDTEPKERHVSFRRDEEETLLPTPPGHFGSSPVSLGPGLSSLGGINSKGRDTERGSPGSWMGVPRVF